MTSDNQSGADYSAVLFRHMRRSCSDTGEYGDGERQAEQQYLYWDDEARDSYVWDVVPHLEGLVVPEDTTHDLRDDIPEKADEVVSGPASVMFSLDVVLAEADSSEDGAEETGRGPHYDLVARPLNGEERIRVCLRSCTISAIGAPSEVGAGDRAHEHDGRGCRPTDAVVSLRRLKEVLRRAVDGEIAAQKVEEKVEEIVAQAMIDLENQQVELEKGRLEIDSIVLFDSETGEVVSEDGVDDRELTYDQLAKLCLKYTSRPTGPTVYIWKPDAFDHGGQLLGAATSWELGCARGPGGRSSQGTCSSHGWVDAPRRVQAVCEDIGDASQKCTVGPGYWVVYSRAGVFMTEFEKVRGGTRCLMGVLAHTPPWPLPRFAEQVAAPSALGGAGGKGPAADGLDIWTARLPRLASLLRPLLDAHANLTQDCPIPRYQMIIDPNRFVSPGANPPDTTRWLPCEFDIDGSGQCTLLGGDHAHRYPELARTVATPILNAALPLLARLRRPQLVLQNQKLQVVFKAQSIIVPPGETYEGVWHIDGLHEKIVAVVLFYYKIDPALTGGALEFAGREISEVVETYGYEKGWWWDENEDLNVPGPDARTGEVVVTRDRMSG